MNNQKNEKELEDNELEKVTGGTRDWDGDITKKQPDKEDKTLWCEWR